jgi:hypothetical protein
MALLYCLNNSKTMGIGGKQHDWEHSLHRTLRGILFVIVSGRVARINVFHLFPEVNRRFYAWCVKTPWWAMLFEKPPGSGRPPARKNPDESDDQGNNQEHMNEPAQGIGCD